MAIYCGIRIMQRKSNNKFTIAYDNIADTLYISVGKPIKATETYMDENDIIVRKANGNICGITITEYLYMKDNNLWKDAFILDYLPSFNFQQIKNLHKA